MHNGSNMFGRGTEHNNGTIMYDVDRTCSRRSNSATFVCGRWEQAPPKSTRKHVYAETNRGWISNSVQHTTNANTPAEQFPSESPTSIGANAITTLTCTDVCTPRVSHASRSVRCGMMYRMFLSSNMCELVFRNCTVARYFANNMNVFQLNVRLQFRFVNVLREQNLKYS